MTDNFVERRANPPPAQDGWHLDKKVPLGLIFAMIVQVVVVTMFFAGIQKDVALLKADVITLHQRDSRIEVDSKEAIKILQDHLTRIDQKLDRLIERSGK
jgi:hypothetical protein